MAEQLWRMPSVIVGNLGSNLEPRWYDRFGIKVTPVHVSVDGKLIDTRTFRSTAEIDTVIRSAKKHPHILGTSAAEFIPLFNELQRHYDEIAGALAAGHRGRELAESAEAVGSAGRFTFAPLSLEYLVRSGRASFLAVVSTTLTLNEAHCRL